MKNNYEKRLDDFLIRVEKARVNTNQHQIVKIIPISKTVSSVEIKKFYNIGQRAFGENRVQDLKEKNINLANLPIEWHFVGRIQTNKINALLSIQNIFIQSCDSFTTAQNINKRALNKKINLLLQVNSSKEKTKAGVKVDEAIDTYIKIQEECKNISLRGLMSIGAHTEDKKSITASFDECYKIFEKLQKRGAKYCSMGMSNDFELAIKSGSNMIRVGRALFDA